MRRYVLAFLLSLMGLTGSSFNVEINKTEASEMLYDIMKDYTRIVNIYYANYRRGLTSDQEIEIATLNERILGLSSRTHGILSSENQKDFKTQLKSLFLDVPFGVQGKNVVDGQVKLLALFNKFRQEVISRMNEEGIAGQENIMNLSIGTEEPRFGMSLSLSLISSVLLLIIIGIIMFILLRRKRRRYRRELQRRNLLLSPLIQSNIINTQQSNDFPGAQSSLYSLQPSTENHKNRDHDKPNFHTTSLNSNLQAHPHSQPQLHNQTSVSCTSIPIISSSIPAYRSQPSFWNLFASPPQDLSLQNQMPIPGTFPTS